jgi:hypothetical protein
MAPCLGKVLKNFVAQVGRSVTASPWFSSEKACCPFAVQNGRCWQILLQKSKVAAPRIFSENKKRKTIADSCTLNRVAELAGEFNVRGAVPSHLYTKDARTIRRIFDHLCKTTFATWGNSGIEPDKGTGNQLSRNV